MNTFAGWSMDDLYPIAVRQARATADKWPDLPGMNAEDLTQELLEKVLNLDQAGRLVKALRGYQWPCEGHAEATTLRPDRKRERNAWHAMFRAWSAGMCSQEHFERYDSLQDVGPVPSGPGGWREVRAAFKAGEASSRPWWGYAVAAMDGLTLGQRTAVQMYADGERVDSSHAARAFQALHKAMIQGFKVGSRDWENKNAGVGRKAVTNSRAAAQLTATFETLPEKYIPDATDKLHDFLSKEPLCKPGTYFDWSRGPS